MKINPHTSELFTDAGQLLKTLHCPLRKRLGELKQMNAKSLFCESCQREIHDTSSLSDDELLVLVTKDPHACLMISPTQTNITVLPMM